MNYNLEEVANSLNFFLIEEKSLTFWGINIPPKEFEMNTQIRKLIKRMKLPYDEVIEIFEDDSLEFFEKVYLGHL